MAQRKFQNEKGQTKFVQKKDGNRDFKHTGNENYILADDEVVFHPAAKIARKVSHACGLHKMM